MLLTHLKLNPAAVLFVMGIVISLSPGLAMAERVLFVAQDGTDDGPGSRERPFTTIQHAVNEAQPGDAIRIGPGTFYERVEIRNAGAEGAPIVLEGARGSDGQRLTRIEAGEAVPPETWEPVPEIGPNVYKNESFEQDPNLLMVNGRFIAHMHRRWEEAMDTLATPEDYRTARREEDVQIPFWEALGGLFAYHPQEEDQVTYLRLAGGLDPREQEIAVSPGGGVVTIHDASHIELRGLEIAAGHVGVHIRGDEARHNIVDDCFITHGRIRVHLSGGASHNTIRNSELTMGFYGATPGSWAGGSQQTAEASTRAFLYYYFKHRHSRHTTSDDYGFLIDGGEHNLIEHNDLNTGLIGFHVRNTRDLMVRHNVVRNFSSVGMAVRDGSFDIHFADNVFYNCSINMRLHRLGNDQGQRIYLYRNRSVQPDGVGQHVFCHVTWDGEPDYPEPEVYFYHNTLVGGYRGWWMPNHSSLPNGVPGFQLINNIFATEPAYRAHPPFREDPDALGVFDYNWIVSDLSHYNNLPAWLGPHNVIAGEQVPESFDWQSEFVPSPDSGARNAGIDLSRPYTIDGVTYDPLPGMEPGYFSGERPDIGAVQTQRTD